MIFNLRTGFAFLALGIASVRGQAASATSSAAPATWTVNVGKLDHKFEPDIVTAKIGDTILFQFYPRNHSVVRAAYGYPCVPYEYTFPGKVGWWSGFKPVDTVLASPPTASFLVNDTEPIFFYCSAPGSCQNFQMVGVINPNASVSLDEQKIKAGQAAFALSPGEPIPDENLNAPTSSVTSSTINPTAVVTITPAAASTSAAANHDGTSFPPGAIAGVVVGGVAILALAAALFYFVGRHRSVKAREAASGMMAAGAEKGYSGAHSPSSPMPGEPVLGPGGMVYVPAKTMDYNRMSMPPQYPQSYPPQEAPLNPMTPNSPSNPHYSMVSTYDMGPHSAHSPGLRSQSPPVEMYTPRP